MATENRWDIKKWAMGTTPRIAALGERGSWGQGVMVRQMELKKRLRRNGLREQENPQREPMLVHEDEPFCFQMTGLL